MKKEQKKMKKNQVNNLKTNGLHNNEPLEY